MSKQEIFELIVRIICEVIPELEGHQFNPEDKLVNLGADSVERAEIITNIMEELLLLFPRVELHGVKNIGELAEVMYEKLQSA
ncbi:acyl carrier protein [Bacillus sp. RC252]|uniref:acyl carrier protein n=1 Tax=Bacillus sp. RC252 TaxID=3156289 RepID=UPI003838140B